MDLPQLSPEELEANRQAAVDIIDRVLALIAVGLRFYAQHKSRVPLWWDDWAMAGLIAVILIPELALSLTAISYGCGRYLEWLLINIPQNVVPFAKAVYVDKLCYALPITLIEVSLCFLYVRLFGVNHSFVICCWIVMGMSIVWGVVTLFSFVFQCVPSEQIDSDHYTMTVW